MPIAYSRVPVCNTLLNNQLGMTIWTASVWLSTKKRPLFDTGRENAPG